MGRSHTVLPVPVQIGADIFRIFFSARDADQRSSIGWVDIDLSSDPRVLREASEPVLAPGEDGTFDDSGIGLGSLASNGEGARLYMGRNLGVRAPWRNAIGLARARTPQDKIERYSLGAILDRSPEDPFTLSYPWVLRCEEGDWRMWYNSNLRPSASRADMTHVVKSARSRDGVRWERDGVTVIGFATPDEYAIARYYGANATSRDLAGTAGMTGAN